MESLTSTQFQKMIANGYVIIDFYADRCAPCQKLAPVLEMLCLEMKEVGFYKVNIEDEKELCKQYEIRSIPSLLLFKDGKVIASTFGYSPKEKLAGWIKAKIRPL